MNTAQIVQLVLALVSVAPDLIKRLMDHAKVTGEMTPEQWDALRLRATTLFDSDPWKVVEDD